MNKNIEESKRLAKEIKAKQQQCYYNAFHVVMEADGYEHADYVEGFAVHNNSLCVEHGWVERDGEIIDPTRPDKDMRYFAGKRYAGQNGISLALQSSKESWCEDLPFFYRFGWGGMECPEHRAAYEAAHEIAYGESVQGGAV